MVNCIVVDDQESSIELLIDYISKVKELQLAGTFINPIEAFSFLETSKVDLVFIDVEMPYLSGLEFIESFKAKHGNSSPKFILITSFKDYAVTGFEKGVYDYLLKPVTFNRFHSCFERIKSDFFTKDQTISNYIFIDSNGRKTKVVKDEICYIEALGHYVNIYCSNTKLVCNKSLSSMLELLGDIDFIRVHKSFIVSIKFIDSIKGDEVFLKLNNKLVSTPIGIRFKEAVFKALNI